MIEEAREVGRGGFVLAGSRLCVVVASEQEYPCPGLAPDHRINILHTCLAWPLLKEIPFKLILIYWPRIRYV